MDIFVIRFISYNKFIIIKNLKLMICVVPTMKVTFFSTCLEVERISAFIYRDLIMKRFSVKTLIRRVTT